MFSKYFQELEKKLVKKPAKKTAKSPADKKSKSAPVNKSDIEMMKESISRMIPSNLMLDDVKMIDPSGFSPEGVDFVAYREYCPDIVKVMNGYIPAELVHGTYHVSSCLDKKSINDQLRNIVQVKKVNHYTERDRESVIIPAFIIAYDMTFTLPELKQTLLDNYMSMGIDSAFEVDIIMILNKGLVIRNWREKRSFIALETGSDTLMWFFILMSEYLDVDKKEEFDLRNYVKHGEKYKEY